MKQTIRYQRLPEVMESTRLSRSSVYERIKNGTFPPQIKLGRRTAAWLANEIDAYNNLLVRGYDEALLKTFVQELVYARSLGGFSVQVDHIRALA
jgi:prophage regulatory protein